jgi:hypothetical protein
VKLPRNGDVVYFVGFEWVWNLTRDFAGVFRELFRKQLVLWDLLVSWPLRYCQEVAKAKYRDPSLRSG